MTEAVKSAERALAVLRLLTSAPEGLTYSQIVAALDLPKSSAHGLLATVATSGFVDWNETTRIYRLGIKTFEAGQTWLASRDLARVANTSLVRVRDRLNETCQLSVLDGTDNIYLAKAEAAHVLVLQSTVGSRLPAYATGLGKALLAGLANDEVERRFASVKFHPFTANTIRSLPALLKALAVVRQRGYATDSGEYTAGVSCVAVPIRDHTGATVAAISVSAPEVRRNRRWESEARAVLVNEAMSFSRELGYREAGSA